MKKFNVRLLKIWFCCIWKVYWNCWAVVFLFRQFRCLLYVVNVLFMLIFCRIWIFVWNCWNMLIGWFFCNCGLMVSWLVVVILWLKCISVVNCSSWLKKLLLNISLKSWMWNNLFCNIDGCEWVFVSFFFIFNLVFVVNLKILFYAAV